MKMSHLIAGIGLTLSTAAALAIPSAPPTVTVYGDNSRTDTRGYIGLNWVLGGSRMPAVVLGIATFDVKRSGETSGAELSLHLDLLLGGKPDLFKLNYLQGNETVQAGIGGGYSLKREAPFLDVGVRGPFVAAGVNLYPNWVSEPNFSVHSLGRLERPGPERTVVTCPSGYEYLPGANLCRWVIWRP